MRREEYACPNGCSLPPRKKQLREYSNGTYGFDFYDFTFCPCCGSLMPYSLKKLKGFFEVYNIHAALSDAVQLIYKSEFESAAREAFVAVENYLKKKSGLDSHGFDLATRALSFETDKQTGEIKRAPLIAINDLKNESQRNEQDGIRYSLPLNPIYIIIINTRIETITLTEPLSFITALAIISPNQSISCCSLI